METQRALAARETEESLSTATIELGRRLRTLRLQRGLTIRELAARAGIANGLLSQIERGASSPSLRTITKLKTALDIRLGDLFSESGGGADPEGMYVKRFEDRATLDLGPHRMVKQLLSPDLDADLQMMLLVVPPGGSAGSLYVHGGTKAGVVLEGFFELTIDGNVFNLRKEDSFQFESSKPHGFRNRHETITARVLWMLQKNGTDPKEAL